MAAAGASPLQLALDGDGWSDERPPRWRDPDQQQQAHLDRRQGDADVCARLAVSLGLTPLEDFPDHQVLPDPAGHPFCGWPDSSMSTSGLSRLAKGQWNG